MIKRAFSMDVSYYSDASCDSMKKSVAQHVRNLIGGASTLATIIPAGYQVEIGKGIINISDNQALASDWIAVGSDLSYAINECVSHYGQQEQEATALP